MIQNPMHVNTQRCMQQVQCSLPPSHYAKGFNLMVMGDMKKQQQGNAEAITPPPKEKSSLINQPIVCIHVKPHWMHYNK